MDDFVHDYVIFKTIQIIFYNALKTLLRNRYPLDSLQIVPHVLEMN
jgi:hypothetical protein